MAQEAVQRCRQTKDEHTDGQTDGQIKTTVFEHLIHVTRQKKYADLPQVGFSVMLGEIKHVYVHPT